ncbi:MAG: trehalose-6-phosphate synthase [Alphaproteobacteria bacterium]|nr:trehalose-6-phosphate synthase [Alphaproteobacteria bacterium]MCW5744319.1 trehalose-6-phosphate synthase [Alphaproteobacteria bacterium]
MRLVVVSDRVPSSRGAEKAAADGRAVAIKDLLQERGGVWFGWSGGVAEDADGRLRTTLDDRVEYQQVDLTPIDRQEYYLGFANRVLWPAMHYRLGLAEFSRNDYAGYLRVNRKLATALMPLLRSDDVIWVHDYHLLPFASILREMGVKNRIGYFHHIPWPPIEVFGAVPACRQLLRGMAAYDLIGVQTTTDAGNLVRGLVEQRGAIESRGGRVRLDGRTIRIEAFPVGIDTRTFRQFAERASILPLVRRAAQSLGNRRLVIGVDRLDYSKGIVERIDAFEQFLLAHPQQRDQAVLLQITPPSRSEVPGYEALARQIDQSIGRINGAHSGPDWVPIRFVKRTFSRQVLAGLYRHAAVGLVTPMRDGMGLVAKEYVAAQDAANPGVLVLSRFAGAARQMPDALTVNPFDKVEVAEAIHTALCMPLEERRVRHARLVADLEARDVGWWARTYLAALARQKTRDEAPLRRVAKKNVPAPPRVPVGSTAHALSLAAASAK